MVTMKFLARAFGLSLRYRFNKKKPCADVSIDGPLVGMQAFEELLRMMFGILTAWYGALGDQKRFFQVQEMFDNIFRENRKSLKKIVNLVYDSLDQLEKHNFGKFNVSTLARDYRLEEKASSQSGRVKNAVIYAVNVHRDYITRGRFTNPGQAVILLDQSIENFLKDRLGKSGKLQIDFPALLRNALTSNVISPRERYRLSLFHRRRVKVQHRGDQATQQTAFSFLYFLLNYYRKRL